MTADQVGAVSGRFEAPDSPWQCVPTYIWRYFDDRGRVVAASIGDHPIDYWKFPQFVRVHIHGMKAERIGEGAGD